MTTLIGLIPGFPFFSFLIILIFGKFIPKKGIAILGPGSIILSAIFTIIAGIHFLGYQPGYTCTVNLWTWINTGGFIADLSLKLDALSLVFCFVITFVGALIHIYSVEFMHEDEGFTRFFAFMNLFVSSMLLLVLADNLIVLYAGWEGVGLCSFLLIGFYYKESKNGLAARKAFIVTRIGDTFMMIGLFLLFYNLGTLNIDQMIQNASHSWIPNSPIAILSTAMLLAGALGKSAQIPLHTWLPDAMAGPSPVSALIHAATMVTAGVYLIARTHVLFALAPYIQTVVAIIGAVTLLVAGISAMGQHDLKRVLAYSTISQIGYMFLALGVGAWSAAIFHFMIHAFFKALLFLAGGAVIYLLDDEHDITKMGGLWKKMPVVFITFLIGSLSLSALPLVTAGFFSKDQILWFSWSSINGNSILWAAGYCGAILTSFYTFRLIFLVFIGPVITDPTKKPGLFMSLPLIVLAFFSVFAGYIELPENFGHIHIFSDFLRPILPEVIIKQSGLSELFFQVISVVASLFGIFIAYLLFIKKTSVGHKFNESLLASFFCIGLGFDWIYDKHVVKPTVWLSEIDKNDFIDLAYKGITVVTFWFNSIITKTENGKIRWYVMAISAGIILIISLVLYM